MGVLYDTAVTLLLVIEMDIERAEQDRAHLCCLMFSCVAYRAALSEPFGNAYSLVYIAYIFYVRGS